jgi:hypothetical protein
MCILPLSDENPQAKSVFLGENKQNKLGIIVDWWVTQNSTKDPVLSTTLMGSGNSYITKGVKFNSKRLAELVSFIGGYENANGNITYAFKRVNDTTHEWRFGYGEEIFDADGDPVSITQKDIKMFCRVDYENSGKEPITYYSPELTAANITEVNKIRKSTLDLHFKKIEKTAKYLSIVKPKERTSAVVIGNGSGNSNGSGTVTVTESDSTDANYYFCAFNGLEFIAGKPKVRYVTWMIPDVLMNKSTEESKEGKEDYPEVNNPALENLEKVFSAIRLSPPFELFKINIEANRLDSLLLRIREGSKASLALIAGAKQMRPPMEIPHTLLTFAPTNLAPKDEKQFNLPKEVTEMFKNAPKEGWEVFGEYKKDSLPSRETLCYRIRISLSQVDPNIISISELVKESWSDLKPSNK